VLAVRGITVVLHRVIISDMIIARGKIVSILDRCEILDNVGRKY